MRHLWIIAAVWASLAPRAAAQPLPDVALSDTVSPIVQGEWWVNAGTPQTINIPPSPDTTITLQPTGLVDGDVIFARFKNRVGVWSSPRAILHRSPYPTSNNKLIEGEWWINTGTRNPFVFPVPATDTSLALQPPGLAEGDILYIRFKSSVGVWSGPRTIVHRIPYPTSGNKLTEAEWWINSGPRHPIPVPAPTPDTTFAFDPGLLNDGDTVKTRVKSSNGVWSEPRILLHRGPFPIANTKLIHGEYFINTDPGIGLGEQIDGLSDSTEISRNISLPGLGPYDVVFVRFQSSNQLWGPPRAKPDVVVNNVTQGWNLISAGLLPFYPAVGTLYPDAISQAFSYQCGTGYHQEDSLESGFGSWLKFDSTRVVRVYGTSVWSDTIALACGGWHLIGSTTQPVDTADLVSIPPGIIRSNVFAFQGGYQAVRHIMPGKGYWVKISQAGSLILPGLVWNKRGARDSSLSGTLAGANRITVSDAKENRQTLYFCTRGKSEIAADYFELPPPPPTGIFDVRFTSGRMLEVLEDGKDGEFPITVSSATGPVTITWEMSEEQTEARLLIGKEERRLGKSGAFIVERITGPVILRFTGSADMPREFALDQNYPNPFNPATTIRYDLPKDSRVSLKLFNLLGQEVVMLVNDDQKAGYRSVEWNATGVSSGVYFYRLQAHPIESGQAGEFVQTRKMLLVK